MMQWLAVGLGGAIGSLLRFAANGWIVGLVGRGFPYGTLFVNVVGSFTMGLAFVLLVERWPEAVVGRAGLMAGVLGGFTTFSSFSIETMNLIESGALLKAGLNVGGSVALCLLAVWAGLVVGRGLWAS